MSEEIEAEIQERIEFKFSELLTAVKNRVAIKYGQAFDMTRESQYAWQAFQELEQMLQKEIKMPPPYDEMAKRKMWEAKELAVKNISESLDLRGRSDYHHKIRIIASEVEKAQKWK